MLSYQHAFHAGNLADLQKHAALAAMLDYLLRKDKPLSYVETHAGRGLYDLGSAEARKTGEAAQGILLDEAALAEDHPYRRALAAVRARHGPRAYPGSPLLAATLLRPGDRLHLAELHPQEHAGLVQALRGDDLTLFGDGGQTRSFCYVDDLVDGALKQQRLLATAPREVHAEDLAAIFRSSMQHW